MKIDVNKTKLSGVYHITPCRFGDHRGFFAETYNARVYKELGIGNTFVQDNHSFSAEKGTVRGLHFQVPPHAQGKLVRCGQGAIFDVAVDLRKNSQTFAQWVGFELSAKNGEQLYIPSGFAHGFMTLEPSSEIVYKCTEYYAPETEGALRWDDPTINISWPQKKQIILSEKDLTAPLMADFDTPFIREDGV